MYYALKNMTILDGHENMVPVTGKAVIVRDGKFEAIVDEDKVPSDCPVTDLKGGYLMPGLINLHLHLPASGKPKKKQMDYNKVAKLLKIGLVKKLYKNICAESAKTNLLSGCTTIRTVGGLPGYDTEVRDKINAGQLVGPRIISADYAISVPGGHMTGTVALPANSVEEAVKMVDDLHDNYKPDIIKLMITGGVLDAVVPGEPGILKMPPEYVEAACKRAHEYGYKVAAHVESTEGMVVALKGGVDTIEHGGKPSEEVMQLFKERGSVLTCTLSPAIPFALKEVPFIGVTEMGYINGIALYNNMLACIAECRKEGITVGLGTDTGCPYITHYDMWRELWYYHTLCGVSENEALHTATEINAKIAGIDDITGTIDAGKCADFIVTDKNPLEDLTVLRNISKVAAAGNIIDSPKIKKMADVDDMLDRAMDYLEKQAR